MCGSDIMKFLLIILSLFIITAPNNIYAEEEEINTPEITEPVIINYTISFNANGGIGTKSPITTKNDN